MSLTEQIDTTTPGGKLIFHLMGALAEFERDLIRERTNAGGTAPDGGGEFGHLSYRLDFPSRRPLFSILRRERSHLLISSQENAS